MHANVLFPKGYLFFNKDRSFDHPFQIKMRHIATKNLNNSIKINLLRKLKKSLVNGT
jgi:hypothetical protein